MNVLPWRNVRQIAEGVRRSPGEAFHAPAQRGDNRFPWKPAVQRCDYLDTVRRPGNTNKNRCFLVVVIVVVAAAIVLLRL